MSPVPCGGWGRAARGWVVALILISMLPELPFDTARAQSFTAASVAELIAAISTANGNGQANIITLVKDRTYTLSVVDNGVAGDETGLPRVASNLTITGNGAIIERSSAPNTPAFRIFSVGSGATLTLSGLTVRNGSLVGVAGTSGGPGTSAPGGPGGNAAGGAVFNSGTLTMTNCLFTANSVVGGAGGNGASGSNGATIAGRGGDGGNGGNGGGGAISSIGTLVIRSTTFAGNSATGGAGGNGGNGGNATSGQGGAGGNAGISGVGSGGAVQNAGAMTVTNATFAANNAIGGAGGNGGAGGTGVGSGIGGVGANGGNGMGGAISHNGGMLTATNVTIGRNSAVGGAPGTGSGGNTGLGLRIGGGIRNGGAAGVTVTNTLLAANTAGDGNCGGNPPQDGGFNLDFNPSTTCGFADHAQVGDPILGSLVNHGGPTPTLDIAPGGAATHTGNPTVCAGTSGTAPVGGVDQRGLLRPAAQCSIGAFEPQATPFPTLASLSPPSGTLAGGVSVTLSGTGFAGGVAVTFGGVPATAVMFVNATTITVTTPAHPSGTVDVIVTNPDMQAATLSPGYTFGIVSVLPGVKPTGSPGGAVNPIPPTRVPGPPNGGARPNPLPPRR